MTSMGIRAMMAALMTVPGPSLPQPFQKSESSKETERGVGKCYTCGKTISANKSFCFACSRKEPK